MQIKVGDSIFYSNGYVKLEQVLVNPPNASKPVGSNELQLQLKVISKEGLQYQANPAIILEGMNMQVKMDTVKAQNLILTFNKVIDQQKGLLEIGVKESKTLSNLITLKTYEFPYINLLWLGVLVTFMGFIMAVAQRLKKLKK